MKDTILKLAMEASPLEPNAEQRTFLQDLAFDYADRFYDSLSEQKAYEKFDKTINNLLDEPIREEASDAADILQQVENRVVPPGLNPVSGNHFGYIPGGGLMSAAIGDYIAAITNRYAGVYASSPGAVVLETRLVNWMSDLVGYPEGSGGYLASGGSIANLTAVVTARDDAGIRSTLIEKSVVYLTHQTHHCVERALNIAGMRYCIRRFVPVDERYRMIPDELESAIQKDIGEGLQPWMIVVSAGSTDTGAIDPLEEIGNISEKYNLWFHVDAAYGGFFLLTDEGKKKMKGIERSDSVVLDPHKGLFLPYGLGSLIVKDVSKLADAHRFSASYMQDTKVNSGIFSPAEISPELSKHFRGMRMWIPLKVHGVRAFRSALQEKLLLARYAWYQLNDMNDIEVGPQPQLTVFTFRWKPDRGDAEEMNRKLHRAILEDGRIFLSTTRVEEKFVLRVAILSVRTHLKEVEMLLKIIRNKTEELTDSH